MAGEPILIVDDTPVNLKLTRILLVNEGYKVLTANDAEEALELLRSFHPYLVLADIQLPGIDGLELTRRIKQNAATRDITVVALTAFAMKGDEQRAIDAGCDGYVTKPIDTRALGTRVREYLDRRAETLAGPAPPPPESEHAGAPAGELRGLRHRFLDEGQEQARQWLLALEGSFDAGHAARTVHQWIGAAGLLGYTAISRLAREVEATLLERPVDQNQLRDSLTALALAFSSPKDARDTPVSAAVVEALSGRRIALVGLPTNECERFGVTLRRVEAIPVVVAFSDGPASETVRNCELIVLHIGPETPIGSWLHPWQPATPVVLLGSRDDLLSLDAPIQSQASEFLMDSWHPEEALIRLTRVMSDSRSGSKSTARSAGTNKPDRACVVVADDDPSVSSLVRSVLKTHGMDAETATNGQSALEAIRKFQPQAAVLDINMPVMDGYEVLAAIRAEGLQVRVVLLTARQQESDVIRGFTLGADDYMVKPFGPLELVARLKRLLWS
ncbi:MAG TPA: response regulator [Bryobacteraceae bacterium]|nr:response regulator [Bryobacteraceae bacterium]